MSTEADSSDAVVPTAKLAKLSVQPPIKLSLTHLCPPTDDEKYDRCMSQSPITPTMGASLSTPQNDSTIILLDWDDTLFPTSTICDILKNTNTNGLALIYDDQIELLTKLGQVTYTLLTHLINRYGARNVHIVTNSLDGWIKDSLFYASCITNIYKDIEQLLQLHDISMQSAQSLHSTKSDDSTPIVWKTLCFDALLAKHSKCAHVISIGDQWTDHDSVKLSIKGMKGKKYRAPTHHVMKMKAKPDLNDMMSEIVYVQICFGRIFDVISTPDTVYFDNPKMVEPVLIDYECEERKRNHTAAENVCLASASSGDVSVATTINK